MNRMARLKHRRRSRATIWLSLCCFTLFSLLPGDLLPSAKASASNPVVICTQDGWVEIDLGKSAPSDQERSHDCGHCVLCFCPSLAGPSHAMIDDGVYGQVSDSLSPSAVTALRRHGPRTFLLSVAPRAPPPDRLS